MISKQLTVFCDGSGPHGPCDQWVYVEALTAKAARKEVSTSPGAWTHRGDRDLCPDCTNDLLDVIAEPDRRRAEHMNRTMRLGEGGDEL